MIAAQVESLGKMGLVEKPIPEPGDDSVLIKVATCAICGSDVRIFAKGDARAKYPRGQPARIGAVLAAVRDGIGRNRKARRRTCGTTRTHPAGSYPRLRRS